MTKKIIHLKRREELKAYCGRTIFGIRRRDFQYEHNKLTSDIQTVTCTKCKEVEPMIDIAQMDL